MEGEVRGGIRPAPEQKPPASGVFQPIPGRGRVWEVKMKWNWVLQRNSPDFKPGGTSGGNVKGISRGWPWEPGSVFTCTTSGLGFGHSLPAISHQLLLPFPAEGAEGSAVSLSHFPSCSAPTVVSREASKNQRNKGSGQKVASTVSWTPRSRFRVPLYPSTSTYLPKGPLKGSPTSDVHT